MIDLGLFSKNCYRKFLDAKNSMKKGSRNVFYNEESCLD